MVKLIINIVFFILSSQIVHSFEKSVIKISSFPCKFKSPVYEGSGVILNYEGEVFVVTSEHILLPNNEVKVCYTGFNDDIGEVKLKIIKNSFENGLSKLKIDSHRKLEASTHSILYWKIFKLYHSIEIRY